MTSRAAMHRQRPRLALGLLGCLGLLVACGGDDGSPGTTSTTARRSNGATVEMPDVVALGLAEAESRVERVQLQHQATNPAGPVTGTDWVVCRTNPPAGQSVPTATRVELVVARPGECSKLL